MVKKILFAAVGAFLSCSSSFCMHPMNDKLLSYISKCRELKKNCKPLNFSTAPYKDKLLEEIGNDQHAIEAFNLFHQHKFSDLVDYWLQNNSNMTSENAERFKEMLLVSAAIIERQSYDGWTFMHGEPKSPCVLKIISIAGGDRATVTREIIKYPQFCFEMMFSLTVDIACLNIDTASNIDTVCLNLGIRGPAKLAQSCESACGDLCFSLDWPIKEDEVYLTSVFPCTEDAGGNCDLRNVWPNWYVGLLPPCPIELE